MAASVLAKDRFSWMFFPCATTSSLTTPTTSAASSRSQTLPSTATFGRRQLLLTSVIVVFLLCLPQLAFPAQATIAAVEQQSPVSQEDGNVTVRVNANLRQGPGTNYPIVGGASAGQTLTVIGQSEAGDWYQLSGGAWIFASLVGGAPSVPVASSPAPAAAPAPASGGSPASGSTS